MRTESPVYIRIAATFTADLVGEPLQRASELSGFPLRVSFADYRQVLQELLVADSAFHRNGNGVNVVLFQAEDTHRTTPRKTAEVWAELTDALRQFATQSICPLIFGLCPSSHPVESRLAEELLVELQAIRGIHLLDLGSILADFNTEGEIYDTHANEVGSIPYQRSFMESLGYILARKIHSLLASPAKVIAVDADETLWRGRVAEDGVLGIELTEGHRFLHAFLQEQSKKGFLLALCSKNELADVQAAFDEHPEWTLKLGDFVASRINWQEKAANLASLSQELNLSTDSFIFIDDDPIECGKVRATHPEITVLELPRNPADFETFLNAVWLFDRTNVTPEDAQRAASYALERDRAESRETATSFEAFVKELQLHVGFHPLNAANLPRSAQLTLRTTQFNLNSVQRTESELSRLMAAPGTIVETVSASDRFGDYGIVGLLHCHQAGSAMLVETLLLSCRALGRGIEHRMLRRVLEHTRAAGLHFAELRHVPTERSRPMRDFLRAFGVEESHDKFIVSSTDAIPFKPVISSADAGTVTGSSAKPSRPDWTTLAKKFATRSSRSDSLSSTEKRTRPNLPELFVPPHSPTERAVADIWIAQIDVDRVGLHDNFFDLGGTSLRLVEVHRQLHERGFTRLTIAELFQFPTVAKLAAHLSPHSSPRTAIDRAKIRGSSQRDRLSKFRK